MEKRRYKFLCYEDRVRIAELIVTGYSQTKIADELGFSNSAISLEFRRVGVDKKGYYPDGTPYDPDDAQKKLRR